MLKIMWCRRQKCYKRRENKSRLWRERMFGLIHCFGKMQLSGMPRLEKKRLFCFKFKLIFVFSVAAWLYLSNCYQQLTVNGLIGRLASVQKPVEEEKGRKQETQRSKHLIMAKNVLVWQLLMKTATCNFAQVEMFKLILQD